MPANTTTIRRGLILLTLHGQYPREMMQAVLERAVRVPAYHGDDGAWTRDLAYLEQRNMIASKTETVAGRQLRSFTILTAGVDLVEGVTTDAGVHIEVPA